LLQARKLTEDGLLPTYTFLNFSIFKLDMEYKKLTFGFLQDIIFKIKEGYDLHKEEMDSLLESEIISNRIIFNDRNVLLFLKFQLYGEKEFFYYKKGCKSKSELEYYSRTL